MFADAHRLLFFVSFLFVFVSMQSIFLSGFSIAVTNHSLCQKQCHARLFMPTLHSICFACFASMLLIVIWQHPWLQLQLQFCWHPLCAHWRPASTAPKSCSGNHACLVGCSFEYFDSHGSGAVCREWWSEGNLHHLLHPHSHHLCGAVCLHVQDLLWWRRAGQHFQGNSFHFFPPIYNSITPFHSFKITTCPISCLQTLPCYYLCVHVLPMGCSLRKLSLRCPLLGGGGGG